MRDIRSLATALLLAAAAVPAQEAGSGDDAGYEVEVTSSLQSAPADSVGRLWTERKTRVGNTEATYGNSSESVFVIGGFTKKCPTAEGIVDGTFEYSLSIGEVTAGDDGVTRKSFTKRATARLEGRVGDDAMLERVEGKLMLVRSTGAAAEEYPISFRPGPHGEPDMESMRRAVEQSADIVVAAVIWQAGQNYNDAQHNWLQENACVEMVFEPPSESRMAAPNEAVKVSARLRARRENAPVAEAQLVFDALQGVGSVSPRSQRTADGGAIDVTYTASPQPKKGHGFSVAGRSRAGVVGDEWHIDLLRRYDLHMESRIVSRDPEQAAQSVAAGTVRLTGARGVSRAGPDTGPGMLFSGSGSVAFDTSPLPGRDPCSSLISGAGTAPFEVVEAVIDVPAPGAAGPAHIEIAYRIGQSGETQNIPFIEEGRCVPGRSLPFPFWWASFLSGREADGQLNLFTDWTWVGTDGVVAVKKLNGNCGGLCNEEITVLTLREVAR